jgi:hypothetical protein
VAFASRRWFGGNHYSEHLQNWREFHKVQMYTMVAQPVPQRKNNNGTTYLHSTVLIALKEFRSPTGAKAVEHSLNFSLNLVACFEGSAQFGILSSLHAPQLISNWGHRIKLGKMELWDMLPGSVSWISEQCQLDPICNFNTYDANTVTERLCLFHSDRRELNSKDTRLCV